AGGGGVGVGGGGGVGFREGGDATGAGGGSREWWRAGTGWGADGWTGGLGARGHCLSSRTALRPAVSKSAMNRMAGWACDFNPNHAANPVRLLSTSGYSTKQTLTNKKLLG